MRRILLYLCTLLVGGTLLAPPGQAETPSPSLYGALGLNTVPSARMDAPGTLRAAVATLDPYLNTTLQAQIAAPLSLSIRQSAEISGLRDAADHLYPGLDFKLRLATETPYRPEVALGALSAFGHKRMAGEYLVATKRYKDFDFTAGMAWGRLGSAGHIKNPLAVLHSHFDKDRALDGDTPSTLHDWFTGPDIGFFGGIEYFTPLDGLSLKADWNADRYRAETAGSDDNAPAPWSLGAHYSPRPWVTLGAALIGGEKFMGSFSLQAPVQNWRGRAYKKDNPAPLYPTRSTIALAEEAITRASGEGIHLYDLRHDDHISWAHMDMQPDYKSLPLQAGRAARHIANHAAPHTEALLITPTLYGLEGPALQLIRTDLERALAHQQGSPAEIWRSTLLQAQPPTDLTRGKTRLYQGGTDGLNSRTHGWFLLDNRLSLSEEDSGLLYRTSLVFEGRTQPTQHTISGLSFRLNLKDNLDHLNDYRPARALPIRSNINEFAEKTVGLDRLYFGALKTLRPDLHIAGTIGHLEEMYSGAHSEILYRPFGKTFALGGTLALVTKRDPATTLNLGLTQDSVLTGHLQAWYEFPRSDLTAQARVGRYLDGDMGGTLALFKDFDHGARLEGFITATNQADYDIFGDTTHLYSGMKLSLPLGHLKHIPERSAVRFTIAPQGRDSGQALDAPLNLYELTTPLSYRHMARHWHEIME